MTKIIFFEGQPGSGKSTLSQYIANQLELNKSQVYWMDEYEHDGLYFRKFWEGYEEDRNDIIQILLDCWKNIINKIRESDKVFILDSAYLSYNMYLMSLEIPKDKIKDYFTRLNNLLQDLKPKIIFLKGDTETIITRACQRRGDNWTEYTYKDIETLAYQQSRDRTGFQGMVEYFADGQSLYQELLELVQFPVLELDVTEENWAENERKIIEWLGYSQIDDEYSTAQHILKSYCGQYQIPDDFPAKNEELRIEFLDDNKLVLKGVYWEDYKLVPQRDTHFLIKGIPMELEFKIEDEQVKGFDYTFIDRKTYFCSKV